MTERQTILLLASYCGDDDPNCTDHLPCLECLKMCNIASAKIEGLSVHGGWDCMRATADGETTLPSKEEPK